MCGIVGQLLYMYCRSGCRASTLASALAFHPPDPCYKLDYHEEDGKYSFRFTDDATNVNTANNITFDMLTTKNKTKVPIVVFTYPKAKYTILYSHGNATDCGAMFQMYALLSTYLKVNVVGYDYTGYGASMEFGIKPTEHQSYQDIDTVFTYIMTSKLVTDPAKELILYGQSIGSGPTCYLAKHRPIAGLVLHSPIMSGLRVLTDSRTLACFDIFPNIRRIAHVNVPLFVIHGQQDVEVAPKHGDGLLNAAPEACRYEAWWVPNRGHNDVLFNNETEFIRRMTAFLVHVGEHHSKNPSSCPGNNSKGEAMQRVVTA